MSEVTGTLEKLVLNTVSKKNGKPIHGFVVNGTNYVIELHNDYGKRVGGYLEKFAVGDEIKVSIHDKYGSVTKVTRLTKSDESSASTRMSNSYKGSKSYVKKEYDATGPIQGMVLGKAIDLAIAYTVQSHDLEEAIISYAKTVLKAKSLIDKLVVDHLGGKTSKKEVDAVVEEEVEELDEGFDVDSIEEDDSPF